MKTGHPQGLRRRKLLRILFPTGLLLAVVATLLIASGVPGPVFQVNSFTPGTQRDPAIGMDEAGDFVVAWISFDHLGGFGSGVFAQRFDASGTPQGPEFQVAADGSGPAVGMDAVGNFVVAWTGIDDHPDPLTFSAGVFAQRFGASGTPQGSSFRLNVGTAGTQFEPAVGMNAAGNFVIAWNSRTFSSRDITANPGIFFQSFAADGTALSGGRVNPSTARDFFQPAVAINGAGNFVVAYASQFPPSFPDIFAQRYNADGISQGPEIRVNTFTDDIQQHPAVGMDAAGTFVVAWDSAGPHNGVFAQRLDAAGMPQGGEFKVNTVSFFAERPAVAMDATGSFLIAGPAFDAHDNSLIFAQSYDATGTPQGSEFQVNTSSIPDFAHTAVGLDPAGSFVIAWTGFDASAEGVFARRYVALPGISINNVSMVEGNSGTTPATFTVTLLPAVSQTVTVNFATADGTATVADHDYAAQSGTLTFAPGETTKQITVLVIGDTLNEPDETFFVNLTNAPSNVPIARAQGRGTILNDDPVPSLSINEVSVTQGDSGTTPAVFTVTLSAASGQTVTANFATADGTATVADHDYVAQSGTLTFSPGQTTKQITVVVNGDTTFEPDETFFVNLSNATNATIADGQGVVTIRHGNTPLGNNVTVALIDSVTGSHVTVTFSNVTSPGHTVLTTKAFGPEPPKGFIFYGPNLYFELSTTAAFSGNVTVCMNFTPSSSCSGGGFGGPTRCTQNTPVLDHFENGLWVDVTSSVDFNNQVVCGTATSLSPFALFKPVDTTPPVITPNVSGTLGNNGWFTSDVLVSWSVTDPESAISSSSGCGPATVTSDTAGTTFTCTATSAGGTASKSFTIKRDATPPILAVTTNPPPNANGWNNSNVSVSFAAVDALSGVGMVSAPVTVTSEGGGQVVTGSATDLAGNLTSGSVTINLDKTAPEAFNQFDPAKQEAAVFGRDSLSGVPPGALTPISVVPAKEDDEDHEKGSSRSDSDNGGAELRTYKVFDLAGNFLLLVERVKKEGHEIKAHIVSLQYNDGQVLALPRNSTNFEWALDENGRLKELEQKLVLGIGEQRQELEAKFDAEKNQTSIRRKEPGQETKLVKPGLVLLLLATERGMLVLEF